MFMTRNNNSNMKKHVVVVDKHKCKSFRFTRHTLILVKEHTRHFRLLHPFGLKNQSCCVRHPLTQTKIRGIRHAHDKEYQDFAGFCAGCILPINTGKELPGESLVIDFETKHFVGTLLMRIKDAPSLKGVKEGETSYFDDKKRRFQAVVKGKFKTKLKMSECVTGQVFYRPAGSLPAKWIVTSFVKFVSTLAPQLEASIDGQEPRFLTPLVATAHTVLEKHMDDGDASSESNDCVVEGQLVEKDLPESDERLYNYNVYAGAQDIEAALEEPPACSETSLMKHVPNANLTDAGSVTQDGKRFAKRPSTLYRHITLMNHALSSIKSIPLNSISTC
jgi:hypothetical protein